MIIALGIYLIRSMLYFECLVESFRFINRKTYVFNFQFLAGVVCKTYVDIDAWYTIKKETCT